MIRKFASFEVLEATLAPVNDPLGLARYAHRQHFTYEPRPGYLYIRSRAISSRCNDNYDEFPASEIKEAYRSFVGKPVFVNHNNDNHRRARGVIIDAALHEDQNPDGTPDTWAEVLMEVDAIRFPKLAEAIIKKQIDRTSMGTDVAFSVCSVCNNKATTPLEYCAHIPKMKGQRIYRTTASGRREGILVREICHGLKFFENSLLVEEPADPTAFFLGVDDHSGLGVTASFNPYVAHGDHTDLQSDAEGPHSHSKITLSPETIADMQSASDAGRMHGEMHDHNERRTVNLADPEDLMAHMLHHGYETTDGHLWRNSEDQDHPALDEADDLDRPLHPHEIRRLHDWEHGHGIANEDPDYNGGEPGHFMGDSHFHTASVSKVAHMGGNPPKFKEGDHVIDFRGDAARIHSVHPSDRPGKSHRVMVKWDDPEANRTWDGKEPPEGEVGDKRAYYEEVFDHHPDHVADVGQHLDEQMAGTPGMDFLKSNPQGPSRMSSKVAYGETMAPADVDTLRDEECPVCGEADAYDGNECQVCGFVAPPKMFQDPNLDTAKSMDLRKDIADGQETDPNEDGMPDVIPGSGQPGTDEIPMNANEVADPDDAGQEQVDKITDEQQPLQPDDLADDGQVVDDEQQPDDTNSPVLMCPECGFETEASPPQTTPTDADAPDAPAADGAVEGDVCPNCGKGLLTTAQDVQQEDPEQGETVPVGRAASAAKGWNDSHADRREGHTQKEQSMRPALAAVAAQQRVIDQQSARIATLEAQVEFIGRLAGVTQHISALKVEADINNPAQPIPDPPSEGAFETTEQAATPEAMDSPLNPGMTPGSVNNLAADTTTTPLVPGEALPTAPFNELQNVQAPIAGTETQRPLEETKIETDVRVGDPMNMQVAFPWTLSSLSADERAERTMASLRLARLRRQAGLSNEDELGLAEKIASDETMIPQVIENEIATLSVVTKNAAQQQARPAARPGGLVPRAASQGVQRTVPSLSAEAGLAAQAGGGSVQDDTADADLFD